MIRTRLLALALVSALLLAAVPAVGVTLAANAGPDKTTSVGTTLSFDGSGSAGSIASYSWNFGDSSTATGVTATHSYSSSGTYTVTLTVVDSQGQSDQDTATITVNAADTTKPSISHTAATTSTPGTAITLRANITDNVGVASATLYYKNSTLTAFQSTAMVLESGSQWKGTIPSSVVAGSYVLYYLKASDSASPANSAGYPSGVLQDSSLALNISLGDTTAPTITHTASTTTATAGQALAISATITDTTGVASATLYYKKADQQSYSSTTMSASGSTYTANIPAGSVTTSHVQYYIAATDSSSNANQAKSPSAAPDTVNGRCAGSAGAPTFTVTAPSSVAIGTAGSLTFSVAVPSGSTLAEANTTAWAKVASSWVQATVSRTSGSDSSNTQTYSVSLPSTASDADGLQYYLQANATGSSTLNGFSGCTVAPKTITTVPAAATLSFSSSSITEGTASVTASWTDVNAQTYELQKNAGGSWDVIKTGLTSTSTTLLSSSLAVGTHSYRIVASTSGASTAGDATTLTVTAAPSTSTSSTTSSTSAPSGGGGGGGGGGGASRSPQQDVSSPIAPPAILSRVVATAVDPISETAVGAQWARAMVSSAIGSLEVDLGQEGVPERITLDVEGEGIVELRVESHAGTPAWAPGDVFRVQDSYFTADMVTIGSATVTGAVIRFAVPAESLVDAIPRQGVLLHGVSEGWEVLETRFLGSVGDERFIFEADTPGFSPFAFAVDDTPPTLELVQPSPAAQPTVARPVLVVAWQDNRGIDVASARVVLDGAAVPVDADDGGFTLLPQENLSPGAHLLEVSVADTSGLSSTESWQFQTASSLPPETTSSGGGGFVWGVVLVLALVAATAAAGTVVWLRRR